MVESAVYQERNRLWLRMSFFFLVVIIVTGTKAATRRDLYFGHDTVEDEYGVIAPWYQGLNGQCDFRVRVAAETIKRYPWADPNTALQIPEYMVNNKWSITEDGTISIRPSDRDGDYGYRVYYILSGLVDYYRYTGDPAAIAHITMQANHLLDYTLTGADHSWPGFPVPIRNKGANYIAVDATDPTAWIQLDIVAQEGLALLEAYQLVGERRWFEAAKHWGDLFAEHVDTNRQSQPWDRYAAGNSSPHSGNNKLTGGVAFILEFLEELIRLGYTGDDDSIIKARDAARAYLRDCLLPAWAVNETWGRYFWDWESPAQTIAASDAAARCFMADPDFFTNWRYDARNVITLLLNRTSVSPHRHSEVYSGAWSYPESSVCCDRALDYAPIEMAAAYGQYGEITQSEWAIEMARRQIILATYHFHETGYLEDDIFGGVTTIAPNWFKITHPWALKHVLQTMSWLPESLGANRENHIMRSSAVVNSVVYGKGKIAYSTFDSPNNTVDVLRLAFIPSVVTADGKALGLRKDLESNGYTLKKLSNGDCIVSIRHDGKTSIVVKGNDPQRVTENDKLHFEGDWSISKCKKDRGGEVSFASAEGSSMEFDFAGNQVRLIGKVDTKGGRADVFVDGVKQLVGIDCWSPKVLHRQVLYYRNGLSGGAHKLKIVVRGEKNARSEGSNVYIDAVQWSNAAGSSGFGSGGGPRGTQRMIFGYIGRKPYIDSAGNQWLPGAEIVTRLKFGHIDPVARSWYVMKQALFIDGTDDEELYQYGVHAPEIIINVTVGPGIYYARLKFAENQYARPNQRGITIHVNDEKMVENMDVFATAGKAQIAATNSKAVDLVYNGIKPKNGMIEIRLTGSVIDGLKRDAIIQALEIGPGNGGKGAKAVTLGETASN